MPPITENIYEQACLEWLADLGWETAHGPDLGPGGAAQEREGFQEALLLERLTEALARINPDIPQEGIDEAVRQLRAIGGPELVSSNRDFHRLLTDGVDVEIASRDGHGGTRYRKVRLLDTEDIDNNDWLALNQYTVAENNHNRRADIVAFVNGMPLAVLELKNPGDERATIRQAFNQLQTYKQDVPNLFVCNELLVVSDGAETRCGTLTADWDRFLPWRTLDGETITPVSTPSLETAIRGLFSRRIFLDYVLHFVVFEDDGAKLTKKAAAYHQYWAVNKALECTLSACGIDADAQKLFSRVPPQRVEYPETVYGKGTPHFGGGRIGVIWHTQGSGKSLSMTFYAGKAILHPAMNNPTLLVITDRNDLDNQLYDTFAGCSDLLRQSPTQAGSREHLRELLQVASGGVVFSTIQKFLPEQKGDTYPLLSDRSNIVVIADEAHRSQYDFIDGFARHLHDALPNASFIGFTATPIESADRNTQAVFGDYIDTYDIQQSVEDGATVPIYYESRLARIELLESEKPRIDPEFEEITEGEEEGAKQKLRTKWAALESMVGTEKRIGMVAEDLVEHFGQRLDAMDGKAMVVCMSRRIAVDMYEAIRKLRPDWHSEDDQTGAMKVVMSGSASDRLEWQPHIRSKAGRERLAKRFRDPEDPLKVAIVRDMWLTGFDCPSLHTMYLDKPMTGHNLMQAIARVNRVFRDKPGGLIVDYIGLADPLKRAMRGYTGAGGRGSTTVDQEQALAVFLEKYEIVKGILHGFDYLSVITGPPTERISGLAQAMDFVLGLTDGKDRYLPAVTRLSQAFALAVPHPKVLELRDEVGFFQELRAWLVKATGEEGGEPSKSPDEMETAIRQLVSGAVASREVVDIFSAAGLDKPDISILSDEFLEEVRALPHKNLALELLKKLLTDEIRTHSRKNIVRARSFAKMLEKTMRKYTNRTIETAAAIEELIRMARDVRDARDRGEDLGLNEDEVAFYDALADNDSAREVMGDEKLKMLALELVESVRNSLTIDWQVRESARADIRARVKRLLNKHGYPPKMQKEATDLVLEQTEVLCENWTTPDSQ